MTFTNKKNPGGVSGSRKGMTSQGAPRGRTRGLHAIQRMINTEYQKGNLTPAEKKLANKQMKIIRATPRGSYAVDILAGRGKT